MKLIKECLKFISYLGKHPARLLITLVMIVFNLTFYGFIIAVPNFEDVIYKVTLIYITCFYLTTLVLFNVYVLLPYFKNKYIKKNNLNISINF